MGEYPAEMGILMQLMAVSKISTKNKLWHRKRNVLIKTITDYKRSTGGNYFGRCDCGFSNLIGWIFYNKSKIKIST